ncbi:MAG: FAD-dependent oxidoreductase, partial [Hyphomicrobiales bacterium]
NRSGTLHLFRDQLSIERTKRTAEAIGALGVRSQVLDPAGCAELEPALAPQADRISGGVHYPDDEAGDAHLFTRRLAELCAAEGADFRYGETVARIETRDGAASAVVTDAGRIEADACVVALGNGSAALVRPLGISLPIYPVKGYSLTFPVDGWNGAPVVPFVDDARKMGIVRMGDRVRVAGTAEFTGHDKTLTPERIANLRDFFLDLFPDYPDPDAGEAWTGLRPTTPDGLPYLGATPIPGLYLNTGHGHLGWTMSCGSAKVLADLVAGQDAEIDLAGMTLADR